MNALLAPCGKSAFGWGGGGSTRHCSFLGGNTTQVGRRGLQIMPPLSTSRVRKAAQGYCIHCVARVLLADEEYWRANRRGGRLRSTCEMCRLPLVMVQHAGLASSFHFASVPSGTSLQTPSLEKKVTTGRWDFGDKPPPRSCWCSSFQSLLRPPVF